MEVEDLVIQFEIEELVMQLAQARQAHDIALRAADAAVTNLESTPEYAAVRAANERAEDAHHQVKIADLALRDAALARFDGEHKRIHPAVNIKFTTDVDVSEESAIPWIKRNAPTYLIETISKDFARAIRAGLLPANIPGVVVSRDVPQVSISQDLSNWLPEEK